jgi:CRP/FNR family transcriptional regulator
MTTIPNTEQIVDQLKTHPFFDSLDPQLLTRLAQKAIWREYDASEIVVLEGEALPGLYYLQSGWIKVVKLSQSGREQVLRFLEPGETFNEIGIFANRPNPATAIALEPAGVWFIPKSGMQQLLRGNPDFAEQLIAQLADRMLHLVSLVSNLSLLPVTGRLAHLLLTEATDDVLHRPRWYTQNELAARLGTVPDVIQRALRKLEKEGLIKVERHLIRILDRQRLSESAEQS